MHDFYEVILFAYPEYQKQSTVISMEKGGEINIIYKFS